MAAGLMAHRDGPITARPLTRRPLEPGEARVSVSVRYASVAVRTTMRPVGIGTEFAGIVTDVNPIPSMRIQIGDRVAGALRHSACSSEVTVPAAFGLGNVRTVSR